MSLSVASAPAALASADLTAIEARDFYRTVGQINTDYQAAEAAFFAAQENLTVLITEQIARHVIAASPDAALLFVRTAAEFHHDSDGNQDPECPGHDHRLAPFEVLDSDGYVLTGVDDLSPLYFHMERLSPILGIENHVLDIETREWAIDCTQD
jgi:hypothetical protein